MDELLGDSYLDIDKDLLFFWSLSALKDMTVSILHRCYCIADAERHTFHIYKLELEWVQRRAARVVNKNFSREASVTEMPRTLN